MKEYILTLFQHIKNDADIIVAIGIILGFIYTCFKKGKAIAYYFYDLAKLPQRIKIIESELTPNGGSSIKDTIKRIEKKHLILDKKLVFALENGVDSVGLFQADSNGKLLVPSNGLCEMLGTSEESLKGLGWTNFINAEDKENFLKEWRSAIENSVALKCQFRIAAKNQSFNVVFHAAPIIYVDKDNNETSVVEWQGRLQII